MAFRTAIVLVLIAAASIVSQPTRGDAQSTQASQATSVTAPSPGQLQLESGLGKLSVPELVNTNVFTGRVSHTDGEQFMSILVLLLGIIVLTMEYLLLRRMTAGPEEALCVIAVTLIIVAALFTIVGTFNVSQITPVIGLLGTIAGYLIGKDSLRPQERSTP